MDGKESVDNGNDSANVNGDYKQISATQNLTNGKKENISACEKGEGNDETTAEEEVLKLEELIKMDEDWEDTAMALLGGSLDSVCTYSEGYKNRQPLYSCKTCFEKTGQLAGICYACSENCHDGHDLVEMYSKRRFCCDCGNSKFEMKCKLFEEKDAFNKRNKYNDNFKGIFCACKKVYPPDENDNAAEDMFQCSMCEDWFHPSHIFPHEKHCTTGQAEKEHLQPDDIEGLICKDCMAKYPFLAFYLLKNGPSDEEISSSQNRNAEEKRDHCKLEGLRKRSAKGGNANAKSVWVEVGWQEELCRCKKCMDLYDDMDCSFLLDPEDTLEHFEKQNREKALQKDGSKDIFQLVVEETKERETALKMLVGIEQMKQHCKEFFKKRAAEKRGPITGEDVEQCFSELRDKRMKLEENELKLGNGPWTE